MVGAGAEDHGGRRHPGGDPPAPAARTGTAADVRGRRREPGQLPPGGRRGPRRGHQSDDADGGATGREHRAVPALPCRARPGPGGGAGRGARAHVPGGRRGAGAGRGVPAVPVVSAVLPLPLRPGHQQSRLPGGPGEHPGGGRGVPPRARLRALLRLPRADRRRAHGGGDRRAAAGRRSGRDRLLRGLRRTEGEGAGGAAGAGPGEADNAQDGSAGPARAPPYVPHPSHPRPASYLVPGATAPGHRHVPRAQGDPAGRPPGRTGAALGAGARRGPAPGAAHGLR